VNRIAILVFASTLILSACIPLPFLTEPTAAPPVDAQATDNALAATLAAQTLNALPTPTPIPVTDTREPAATDTKLPTSTQAPSETATFPPDLTTTITTTATFVETVFIANSQVNATATETLHPRFYGTLPPAIPYGKVALINRAKAEVYVSLQCTTIDGYKTILEYPVFGRLKVSAPVGRYTYVAWVGGREFQGSFQLGRGDDLTITFTKEKVSIN
jgi:hypothetical protein